MLQLIVVGGGVIGSCTALSAARLGARALLLEQFEAGHERGSSHGDGRIYRYAYEEEDYAHLSAAAIPLWEQLERESGSELMKRCGGLSVFEATSEGQQRFHRLQRTFQRLGLLHDCMSGAEAHERFPQVRPPPDSRVIFSPDGGVIRATDAVLAARKIAEKLGASSAIDRVISVRESGNSACVETESGEVYEAAVVVIAAGPWTRNLLPNLPIRLTQEIVSYWPAAGGQGAKDYFSAMPSVMFNYANELTPYGMYSLPQMDREGVKCSGHYSGATLADPDRPHGLNHPRRAQILESTREFVSRAFPLADTQNGPSYVQSCLYSTTPDHDFIIDRAPVSDTTSKLPKTLFTSVINTTQPKTYFLQLTLLSPKRISCNQQPKTSFSVINTTQQPKTYFPVIDTSQQPSGKQQSRNVFVCAGFSGHGFKFGTAVGEAMARMALGMEIPKYFPAERFSAMRFKNGARLGSGLPGLK